MAVAACRAPWRHFALENFFFNRHRPRPRFLVGGQRHRVVAVGMALETLLLEDLRDLAVEDDLRGDWHVAGGDGLRPQRVIRANGRANRDKCREGSPPVHVVIISPRIPRLKSATDTRRHGDIWRFAAALRAAMRTADGEK